MMQTTFIPSLARPCIMSRISWTNCSRNAIRRFQNSTDKPPPLGSPSSSTSSSSASASSHSRNEFKLLSQDVIFRRYQTVYKREVEYPDGRVLSFDVLGNEKSNFQSVFIFPFNTITKTATLISEYSPGRNSEQLSLVAGMYEPAKHSSLEHAARDELSEEALLTGGTLIPLAPDSGISADKYSRNNFFYYLAIDCRNDEKPRPRDEEEWIHVVPGVKLSEVRWHVVQGSLNVPHSLCALLALDKLKDMGYSS